MLEFAARTLTRRIKIAGVGFVLKVPLGAAPIAA
jgi:hypothetical protein